MQDDEEKSDEAKDGKRRLADAEGGSSENVAQNRQDGSTLSKRNGKGLQAYVIALLDMCAFVGGAWFILTRAVFGPIGRMFEHDLYVADVDQKVVIREYTGDLAPGQN